MSGRLFHFLTAVNRRAGREARVVHVFRAGLVCGRGSQPFIKSRLPRDEASSSPLGLRGNANPRACQRRCLQTDVGPFLVVVCSGFSVQLSAAPGGVRRAMWRPSWELTLRRWWKQGDLRWCALLRIGQFTPSAQAKAKARIRDCRHEWSLKLLPLNKARWTYPLVQHESVWSGVGQVQEGWSRFVSEFSL